MQEALGWFGLFVVGALLGGTLVREYPVASACSCIGAPNWWLERVVPDGGATEDVLWPATGMLDAASLTLFGEDIIDIRYAP